MAGQAHQIQIRHILLDKKDVAELLKETVDAVKTETGRVKMLMNLASKYSKCPSKVDGGNLGWIEVGWEPANPRNPRGGYKTLHNQELYDIICDAVGKMDIRKGKVYGPVQTAEGYHLVMISNEVKVDRIL